MNKKAQVGPIGAVMLFIVFLILWFVWLGGWVAETGRTVVVENNLIGVEAFFFDHLNLVIYICMILGVMGWMYFGGRE